MSFHFVVHDSICWAHYMLSPVRPSHGWISRKRLNLGSCNFHHTVAPSLCCLWYKFHPEIPMASPRAGRQTRVGWGNELTLPLLQRFRQVAAQVTASITVENLSACYSFTLSCKAQNLFVSNGGENNPGRVWEMLQDWLKKDHKMGYMYLCLTRMTENTSD